MLNQWSSKILSDRKCILEKLLSLKKQNLKSCLLNIDTRSGFFEKSTKDGQLCCNFFRNRGLNIDAQSIDKAQKVTS